MMKIESLRPNGRIDNSVLVELGSDPELDKFMVVAFWRDGTQTAGWPADMKLSQLAFGLKHLELDVNSEIIRKQDGES